jgi:hypothetical protein
VQQIIAIIMVGAAAVVFLVAAFSASPPAPRLQNIGLALFAGGSALAMMG